MFRCSYLYGGESLLCSGVCEVRALCSGVPEMKGLCPGVVTCLKVRACCVQVFVPVWG